MLENFQWFLVLPELLILVDIQRSWRNVSLRIFLDYISGQENKGKSGKMVMLYYKNSEALGDSEGITDAFIFDSFIFKMLWL